MGSLQPYARAIRMTSTGVAINRPTTLSAIAVTGIDADVLCILRDGGATGAIMWVAEGDNGAGTHPHSFDPPIRFYKNIHVTILTTGTSPYNGVCLAVIEH